MKGYRGIYADFSQDIQDVIATRQVEQGNEVDMSKNLYCDKHEGGFSWRDTPEGNEFWEEVLISENTELFYTKYPRSTTHKKMVVNYMGKEFHVQDEVVQNVILQAIQRAAVGYEKYGTTLKDNNTDDMLNHALEEIDDLYKYLMKIRMDCYIQHIDKDDLPVGDSGVEGFSELSSFEEFYASTKTNPKTGNLEYPLSSRTITEDVKPVYDIGVPRLSISELIKRD